MHERVLVALEHVPARLNRGIPMVAWMGESVGAESIGGGAVVAALRPCSAETGAASSSTWTVSNSVASTIAFGVPPVPLVSANASSRVTDHILRAGINYHFAYGLVVARY